MGRRPRPWRRGSRGWFVTLDGKQVFLGRNKAVADKKFHELMLRRPINGSDVSDVSVPQLVQQYLTWCQGNLAEITTRNRTKKLLDFADMYPRLKVTDLRPIHVQAWVNQRHAHLNSTSQHTAITLVQACLSWSQKMGIVEVNRLRAMPKPRPEVRQEFIDRPLWGKVLDACRPHFRDLLEFMLWSGIRPQEIALLTTENLDTAHRRFIFSIGQSKGRLRSRMIFVPQRVWPLVQRAIDEGRVGHVFLDKKGKPWNSDSVKNQFKSLKRKLNMPKLCATTLRHSFAHARLTSGQDALTVATLMGHVDVQMLSKRYGHLSTATKFLQAAADDFDPLDENKP